jgi:hypothetical protein
MVGMLLRSRLFGRERVVYGRGRSAVKWAGSVGGLDVDLLDADLGLATRPGVPGAVADQDVAQLGQPEAAPLALGREALAALAAELEEERLDLALRPPPQDVGAHLTPQAVVGGQDLPLVPDGVRDHLVERVGHAPAPPVAPWLRSA